MENAMFNFCGKEIEILQHMYAKCDIVKNFRKGLRSIFNSTLIILLLGLPTTVFHAYTHELLLISLIVCVAKYAIHMSRNNKCIPKSCHFMKLI